MESHLVALPHPLPFAFETIRSFARSLLALLCSAPHLSLETFIVIPLIGPSQLASSFVLAIVYLVSHCCSSAWSTIQRSPCIPTPNLQTPTRVIQFCSQTPTPGFVIDHTPESSPTTASTPNTIWPSHVHNIARTRTTWIAAIRILHLTSSSSHP